MNNELTKTINKHEYGATISFLDEKSHSLALSEMSVSDKSLVYSMLEGLDNLDLNTKEKIIASLENSDEVYFYSRLNVPKKMRGQGLGNLLMEETIKLCEEKNIFLINTVNPYGDLNMEELIKFYQKHGMTLLHEEGLMIYSKNLDLKKEQDNSNKSRNKP